MARLDGTPDSHDGTEPELLSFADDNVLWLTLNRPERLNALTPDMLVTLKTALKSAEGDDRIGAVVVTGQGRAFCAGGDVKNMAGREDWTHEQHLGYLRGAHETTLQLARFSKPTVAMLNGACFGAGLSLALCCDFRIAARTARLGTAFANVGLSGDHGASWLLTRLVGTASAKELMMLARPIDAEKALVKGLVHEVVDESDVRTATLRLAGNLAAGPRLAYRLIKRNVEASATIDFEQALDLEATSQANAMMSQDHREARIAFAEKRPPRFGIGDERRSACI
jgi:2-(1,2-epoxy-1,2-dihydrophenyl)acetyl-CoA isomerase